MSDALGKNHIRNPGPLGRNGQERVDCFKRTIDVLTLLVLTGGFYFAYDQAEKINLSLRKSQHNNDLAVWNAISQQWLALDKLFIENPEIRPYIYSKQDISPSDAAFNRIHPYATYILDFIDFAESSATGEQHEVNFIHPEAWELYFMQIFSSSPMVCRELFADELIFNSRTRSLAHRACDAKAAAAKGAAMRD